MEKFWSPERVVALLSCFFAAACARPRGPDAAVARAEEVIAARSLRSSVRGWDHLTTRLAADGVPREVSEEVYGDPAMPPFSFVPFSPAPKDTRRMYGGFRSPERIRPAREFMRAHRGAFLRAARTYGVDPSVVAAIITIETGCGRDTGRHLVLERLSRVASVREPVNLEGVQMLLEAEGRSPGREAVARRAEYLEKTFYPEVLALFRMRERHGTDLLSLKGSGAGAFGLPQFLPSSFLRFGVDGDRDGVTSLFDPDDAVVSTASFLAGNGWRDDASRREKEAVVWRYNKSEPYVETVLAVADDLAGAPGAAGR